MMRTSTAVQVGLVLLLPVACFALIGSRNRITVRKYRTNYRIDSWDDDREDPYRVTFWKFGLKSVYTFDTSGNIKTLTARDTLYTFDEEVGPVIRTRMLQDSEDDVIEVDVDPVDEIACSDCHQTWNTVCAEGLDDVCYLDDNPLEEFDEDAIDSTRRFCSGFGAACEYTADEACGGQCTQDDSDSMDPPTPTPVNYTPSTPAPVYPTPTPVEDTTRVTPPTTTPVQVIAPVTTTPPTRQPSSGIP
eukprot:jgi/Undpi1/8908/HiC_scaffold_25.g11369.m1